MSHKNLLFLLLCLFLFACSDENDDTNGGGGNPDRTETQAWIENTMRQHYFWNKEIPDADKLGYKAYEKDPRGFFTSLLTKKDGKTRSNGNHYYYSYIEDLSATRSLSQTDYTYGFEFTAIYRNKAKDVMALVLYVVKDSPAYKAGLKRGDWIIKIDGKPIKDGASGNLGQLVGGDACIFTIERWDNQLDNLVEVPERINIASARAVEDNPVFADTIISSPKGTEVGYLVYNHFTDGTDSDKSKYDNELRKASSFFQTAGVEEFVLDLRYNNGGLLSSALVLCAILAPEQSLNKEFGYLAYNDGRKATLEVKKEHLNPSGKNLNLKKLYVLVSGYSASASEMIINSLKPYMDVVVIGEQTEGKNVGSVSYTSEDKLWKMHPIVCQIYNVKGQSDYANGFTPDVELNEAFVYVNPGEVEIQNVLPLGDSDERLLNAALLMIDGTHIATDYGTRATGIKSYQKANIHSIDRKATNGVIIE